MLLKCINLAHFFNRYFIHDDFKDCPICDFSVTLAEMIQVLRGAGKVGNAFASTQGEQLRLMACNSTFGAGVKAAQEVVEGVMGTFTGGDVVGEP